MARTLNLAPSSRTLARATGAVGLVVLLTALVVFLRQRPAPSPSSALSARMGGQAHRGPPDPEPLGQTRPVPERDMPSGVVIWDGRAAAERAARASVCAWSAEEERPLECVLTDEQGRFSLADVECGSDLRLVISAPGRLTQTHTQEGASDCQHLVVHLASGGVELAGTVVDAGGGTIAGAEVRAGAPGLDGPPSIAVSGADGEFRLSVPAGDVELVATADAYSRAVQTVSAPREGLVLTLVPASTIQGEVVLPSGSPVADARVIVRNKVGIGTPPRNVRTSSEGHFSVSELPAGSYEISATKEALRAGPEWVNVAIGDTSAARLIAEPASMVLGSVDVDGAPCAAGLVAIRGPVSAAEPIDGAGKVQLEGLPRGRYAISVRCTAVALEPSPSRSGLRQLSASLEEVAIVDRDSLTTTWSLTEPKEPASSQNGNGIIRVRIAGAEPAMGLPRVLAVGPGQPVVGRSDGQQVLLSALAAGEYDVYLEMAPAQRQHVTLRDDRSVLEITLDQPPRESIAGRVLDERGVPVPDAWVTASHAGHAPETSAAASALSDQTGDFVLTDLARGTYEVSASSPVGEGLLRNVATDRNGVQLRLVAHGAMSGSVLGPDGTPVPHFTVYYQRLDGGDPLSLDGVQGKWSLPWLAPGSYRLSATSLAGCGRADASLEAGGSVDVQIRVERSSDICSEL